MTYYNVGKELVLAGKHYGDGIIKKYSEKLTNELGKGHTFSSLTRMKKILFISIKTCDIVATINIWSLYRTFANKQYNKNKILYNYYRTV